MFAYPLSSTSPEIEDDIYQLEEETQFVEQARTKRSITALLAAEVIFLEGILAAQNSRKARKLRRPVTNQIDTTASGKRSKIKPTPTITQYTIQPHKTTTQKTSPKPISQLDPFTMLDAPDLSRQPIYKQKSEEEVSLPIEVHDSLPKYGEFDLYEMSKHITSHHTSPTSLAEIITAPPTSSAASIIQSPRQPRKRTLKYGAFELYEPSTVFEQNENFIITNNKMDASTRLERTAVDSHRLMV